jgi:hypothetical protein
LVLAWIFPSPSLLPVDVREIHAVVANLGFKNVGIGVREEGGADAGCGSIDIFFPITRPFASPKVSYFVFSKNMMFSNP